MEGRNGAGRSGRILLTAVLVVPVLAVAGVLTSSFVRTNNWGTALASTDRLNEAGVLYISEANIFLVARNGGPVALSARSPHLGHALVFCTSSGLFEGRHGEKFDRFGRYFGGPAPRGMDGFAARVAGDRIRVDLDHPTAGPPRDSSVAQEPLGPFCRVESGPSGIIDARGRQLTSARATMAQ